LTSRKYNIDAANISDSITGNLKLNIKSAPIGLVAIKNINNQNATNDINVSKILSIFGN